MIDGGQEGHVRIGGKVQQAERAVDVARWRLFTGLDVKEAKNENRDDIQDRLPYSRTLCTQTPEGRGQPVFHSIYTERIIQGNLVRTPNAAIQRHMRTNSNCRRFQESSRAKRREKGDPDTCLYLTQRTRSTVTEKKTTQCGRNANGSRFLRKSLLKKGEQS